MLSSENSSNSAHLLVYANSKKTHNFQSVFSEETALLFDSKEGVIQNFIVWRSFPHSEIQPDFLSLKMLHWGNRNRDADQLLNTFYSFHLAPSQPTNYSYAIICIQLVVWAIQGRTVSAMSAELPTFRCRAGSKFQTQLLPVQSTKFWMSELHHIA